MEILGVPEEIPRREVSLKSYRRHAGAISPWLLGFIKRIVRLRPCDYELRLQHMKRTDRYWLSSSKLQP